MDAWTANGSVSTLTQEGRTSIMPTKRMFDMTVLTVLMLHPVLGLAKMWAARVSANPNAGVVSSVAAGATRIVA